MTLSRTDLRARTLGLAAALVILVASALAGCSEDPAREGYYSAETLLGRGDYTGAIGEYSRVAETYQESPYAPKSRLRMGEVFGLHLSDQARAMDAYSKLLYLHPESPEAAKARLRVAEIYSERGEHLKAIEQYERLLMEDPSRGAGLQYLIASEYLKMNDFRQARVELQEVLEREPGPETAPEVMYRIAYSYYIEGKTDRAVDGFDELARKYPEGPWVAEAMMGKAKALEDAGRLSEALEVLEALADDHPNPEVVETRMEWIRKRLRKGP